MTARGASLFAAAGLLIAAGFLPLCVMAAASLRVDGAFSLGNYAGVFGNARTWLLLRNSALLALCSTAMAGALGVPLAVLLAKTDLPGRKALTALFALPLLLPPYVLAVGWFEILGRGGLLAGLGASETTSRWLFGFPGAALVLGTAFLPVVLLLGVAYLRSVSPTAEEAARLSSAWPAVLRHITIPLAMPGGILALVLVFLLSMGEFGAPSFLRYDVLPVASFTQFAAFYDFGAATAAASPILLATMLGLWIERRVLGQREFFLSRGGGRESLRIPLGSCKWPALSASVFVLAILVIAPLAAIVRRGLEPGAIAEALTRAGGSTIRSLAYSGVSATSLAMAGFLLAYLIHRRTTPAWPWLDALGLFLFTLPGTVLGVGLILLWNRPATSWFYATPALLVAGFLAQYAALAARTILAGFTQIPPSMEEAAQVCGAGWFRRVTRILVPLLRPAVAVSWGITFIFCLRDLSLPLLLAPPGRDTLTARTMTLMANGSPKLIAALCLISMLLTAVPLGVVALAARRWRNPS